MDSSYQPKPSSERCISYFYTAAARTFTTPRLAAFWLTLLAVLFARLSAAHADAFINPVVNKNFSPISIAAGGTSRLSIIILNSNASVMSLSTDPAALQDTLPAGLYFASPPNVSSTCGGTVLTLGTTLTLIGGSVAAQTTSPGSCTVSVDVTSTTPGNLINTINPNALNTFFESDPANPKTNYSNLTQAEATLRVDTVQPPTINKSLSPNTIWVGGTSTLTIRVRNSNTTTALTHLSLTDNLPAGVTVASAAATQCSGTVTTTASSISLSGGSVPAMTGSTPGTCDLVATLTSATPGVYTNSIPPGAIQTQQGVTNAGSASAQLNVQAISVAKSFAPATVQAGGSSTLTITLTNPTASPYTNAALTDTLPAGMTVASAPIFSCVTGTTTYTAGSISLSGATIPANSTCTLTAGVTVALAASYTNTIPAGGLTAQTSLGGTVTNVVSASANLSVYAAGYGLGASKSFNPTIIGIGGVSRLSIQFSAPADSDLTQFAISDALPAGVHVATSPSATKSGCGSGTFSPQSGDILLSYSGGTITRATTCTLAVNVTATAPGTYTNTISSANISNAEGRNYNGSFSATLTASGISVSKAFYPTQVSPGGISTLTITLTNINTRQLDSVAFTDTLPGTPASGLTIARDTQGQPLWSTSCAGGQLATDANDQAIILTGATIPAQVLSVPGVCTVVVDVIGKGSGPSYTNSLAVGAVTGTLHGTATVLSNTSQASASLSISPLQLGLALGFNPIMIQGNSTSTLTIEISNPNNVALSNLSFSKTLPAGLSVAPVPNYSTGTCGGQFTLTDPPNPKLVYSGGSLAANATCSLSLSMTMSVPGTLPFQLVAGAVTSGNGAANAQDATATLANTLGLSISKIFLTNPILAGSENLSTLKISIQNTSNVPLYSLNFIDQLPAGMTFASPANASTTCSLLEPPSGPPIIASLTADPDTRILALSGGWINQLSECTVSVDITAPNPGSYTNTIGINQLTASAADETPAKNSEAASDTLVVKAVVQPPSISKAFSPAQIPAGSASVLTFTLTNPSANSVALTGVSFSDTFPDGLVLASVPNPAQCGGSVSSTAGSVSLAGGTIATGGSCTVTVSVTAATGGSYANTSGAVSSVNGGEGSTASATLVAVSPPTVSKSFASPTIALNGSTLLTLTLANPAQNTVALTGVGIVDRLPAGLETESSSAATDCTSGTASQTAGQVSLQGAALPVNSSCTLTVTIKGISGGAYTNITDAVTSSEAGSGGTASAELTITGPGLQLQKTATPAGYRAVGETVHYTFTLVNSGTVDLYPPYAVNDPTVGTVTCPAPPSQLTPGQSLTCSADYTILAQDVTARSLTNTATATASDAESSGGTITSNSASATVYLEALTLTKRTSTTGYRSTSDKINYTYTLTNSGTINLYPPYSVADDKVSVTCPGTPAVLYPGMNVICSAQYSVVAADLLTPFAVTNTASATAKDAASSGQDVTSSPASVTVYRVNPPSISKQFSPAAIPTGTASLLTFTITNPNSSVPLSGVSFTDSFPTGLAVASDPDPAQCGGTVSFTSTSISLSGGTVMPDDTCSVTVSVSVANLGVYANTSGTVTSSNGGSGNTASASLTAIAPPALVKAFSPIAIILNEANTTLTFTITNPNQSTLSGVAFSDTLPGGLKVANPPQASLSGCDAASTPVFAPAADDLTLTLGDASLSAAGVCTLSVKIQAVSGGIKVNQTGAITSSEGGTGAPSNSATLQVYYPELTLAKSIASGSPYRQGGTIQYSYLLRNTGTVTLIGNGPNGLFTVTDDRASVTCPATPTGLEPDGTLTCTASYTTTNTDWNYGSVKNTATAYGRFNNADVTSNSSSQIADAVPVLAKVLTTTEFSATGNSAADQAAIGEKATYTLTLTLPKGTTRSSQLVDVLDVGLSFVDVASVTLSAGVSSANSIGTGATPANVSISSVSGGSSNKLIFNFGDITNSSSDYDTRETITIVYHAIVENRSSSQAGTRLNNAAAFNWLNGASTDSVSQSAATAELSVVEPSLSLSKTRTATGADAGDTTSFSLTISNGNAASDTVAYVVELKDVLPSGLTLAGTPVVGTCSAGAPDIAGTTTLTATWASFPVNSSCTITFDTTLDAAVYPGQTIAANTAELRWASITGARSGSRSGPSGAIGSDTLNDYGVQSSTTTFTLTDLQLLKSLAATSESATSGVSVAIGESARYRLVTRLPEGTSPDLQLRDTLPTGLQYLDDGTTRVAFVSNNAAVASTTLSGAGLSSAGDETNLAALSLSVSSGNGLVIGTNASFDDAVSASRSTEDDTYSSGSTVIFKLGTVTNSDDDANAEFIVIEFNALVRNETSNQAGTQLQNSYTAWLNGSGSQAQTGSASGSGTPSSSAVDSANTLTVVEPWITNLTKTINTPPADAGDSFSYILNFSNSPSHPAVDAARLRVATTANLSGTFAANQLSGVSLTGGSLVIDGVSLALNDRVLVKNQTTGAQNGIYFVSQLNLRTSSASLVRAPDFDESAEAAFGLRVYVESGTAGGGKTYALSTTGTITLNTTSLSWGLAPANPAVKAATTAAIGTGFSSNQITGVALTTGSLVIDGVTLVVGDRVLVQNQAAALQNGVYTVSAISGSATLARAADFDQAAEFTAGLQVFALNGTANASRSFALVSAVATLNTSAVTWRAVDSATAYALTLTDPLPAGVLFQSIRIITPDTDSGDLVASGSFSGGSVSLPTVGSSGTISLSLNSLAPAVSLGPVSDVTLTITVKTADSAAAGASLFNRASLSYTSAAILADCSASVSGSCLAGTTAGAANSARTGQSVTPTDNTPPAYSTTLNNYAVAASAGGRLNTPLLDKRFQGGSLSDDDTSLADTTAASVALGESVTYDILVSLPEGLTQNLTVIDALPAGLRLDNSFNTSGYQLITTAAGSGGQLSADFSGTLTPSLSAYPSGTLGADGVDAQLSFGSVSVSATSSSATSSFIVRLRAIADNIMSNQDGGTLTNSASLTYTDPVLASVTVPDMAGSEADSTPYDPTVTILEPILTIAKQVSPTSVDAGDALTYTITLANPSASSHAPAYDIALVDTLPDDFSSPTIDSVTTSGATAAASDFEIVSSSGHYLLQVNATSTLNLPLNGSITIVLTGSASSSSLIGQQITNRASLLWTSYPGTSSDERSAADASLPASSTPNPALLNNYAVTASAAYTTNSQVVISKSILATDQSSTTDNFSTPMHNAAIGEIVTYRVTVSLPEGVTPSLAITDNLPAGLAYLPNSLAYVGSHPGESDPALHASHPGSGSASFNGSGAGLPSVSGSPYTEGADLTFTFGAITVSGDNDANNNTFYFTYQAILLDVAGNAGLQGGQVTRTNGLSFSINGGSSSSAACDPGGCTLTAVEPKLNLQLAITLGGSGASSGDAGDAVLYSAVISHQASSLADAFDLTFSSALPAEFAPAGIADLAVTAAGVDITAKFEIASGTLQTKAGESFNLPLGQSAAISFTSALADTVTPKQSLSTSAALTYTSLPGDQTQAGSFNPSADVTTDHERAYSASAGAVVLTISGADLSKSIYATSQSETASANVAVGEVITYALTISLPEGTSPATLVVDTLPAGLQYVASSASLDTTGFSGTAALDNVTTNSNQVTFDLGSISVPGTASTAKHSLTLRFEALVQVVAGNEGLLPGQTALSNSAALTVNSTAQQISNTVTATVVEPQLQVTKSLLNNDTSVDYGTVLNYRILITHTAASTGPAFDLTLTDPLASGLPLDPASLTITPSAGAVAYLASTDTSDANNGLRLVLNRLDLGDSITITYSAAPGLSIAAGSTVSNTANLSSYTTIPAGGRSAGPLTSSASFTLNTNALSGYVYKDLNNNGAFDEAGSSGLASAAVRLVWAGPDGLFAGGDDLTFNTTADASGEFAFSGLRQGSYRLSQPAQPAGLLDGKDTAGGFGGTPGAIGSDLITITIPADSNQSKTGYLFGELPPASISGLAWLEANGNAIRDPAETALEGVTITLSGTNDLGALTPSEVTSDSAGLYAFTDLRPGSYQVHFAYSSYQLTVQHVGADLTIDSDPAPASGLTAALTLAAAQDLTHIDAGLYPAETIAGKLWYDVDAGGTQNGSEPPIAGASISVTWAGPDGQLATSADNVAYTALLSAADGSWSLANLAPGAYRVSASGLPNGLTTPTYDPDGTATPNQVDLVVALGDSRSDLDFGYRGSAALGDLAWADFNDNGLQDAGEPPLPGIQLTLTWAGPDGDLAAAGDNLAYASVTTDASGLYAFSHLPAGKFQLAAVLLPGYAFGKLHQGADPTLDSDFDPATAKTGAISLTLGGSDQTVDLGGLVYAIAKSLPATSLASTASANVAIGEVLTYELALAFQEGVTSGVLAVDTLPVGLQYVPNSAALDTSSFSGSASISSVTPSGSQLSFSLDSVTVNPGATAAQRVLPLRFQAFVRDIPANGGLPASQAQLDNSATLQAGVGITRSSNTVTATVVEPQLTLAKTFQAAYTRPGDPVTVQLVVSNTGTAPAYEILLEDPLSDSQFGAIQAATTPAGFTFSTTDTAGVTTVRFTAGAQTALAAGSSLTFTFQATVRADLTPGTTLHNTATIKSYATLPDLDVRRRVEAEVSSNADLSTSFADLSVVLSDAPDPLHAGATLTYTLQVANAGPYTASQLSLSDSLPAGLTYLDAQPDANHAWTCAYTPGTRLLNCSLASLAKDDTSTITLTASAASDLTGQISSTAAIASIVPDPELANNQSTAHTTLDALADLAIVKSALAQQYAGTSLQYTLQVSNTGPSDAHSLSLSDTLPAGVSFTSIAADANHTWSCSGTATLQCTLPGLAAGDASTLTAVIFIGIDTSGTLSNTAVIASATTESNTANNSSTALTAVLPAPYLLASKTVTDVNGDGIITPGELLEYTLVITNQGQSDALQVVLTDQPAANLALVAGSVSTSQGSVTTGNAGGDTYAAVNLGTIPSGGDPVTVKLRMRIASPLPAGVTTVSNQAVLSGSNFQPVSSDYRVEPQTPGQPTVTLVSGTPRLVAIKTASLAVDPDNSLIPSPGDTLLYTIVITNQGDAAESAVTLTDTPDPNTRLVVGSVSTTQGSVTSGNSAGQSTIAVSIGTLGGAGAQVTITFQAAIKNPLPAGTTTIHNQGTVTGQSSQVSTDDPRVAGAADPTDTPVLGPTAISLLQFRAQPMGGRRVEIRWTTAAEINNYGFWLRRAAVNDPSQAANVAFIPSAAGGSGAVYRLLDTVPSGGRWYYWLYEVDMQGRQVRYSEVLAADIPAGSIFFVPMITR